MVGFLLIAIILIVVWLFVDFQTILRDWQSPRATAARNASTDDAEVTYDWNGHTIHFSRFKNSYGKYEYWTRDRRHFFCFDIVKATGEARIYILQSPDYGRRSTDLHATHRLYDRAKGYYVCVRDDLKPTNVPDALSWMIYWAEQTGRYIDTGRSFA